MVGCAWDVHGDEQTHHCSWCREVPTNLTTRRGSMRWPSTSGHLSMFCIERGRGARCGGQGWLQGTGVKVRPTGAQDSFLFQNPFATSRVHNNNNNNNNNSSSNNNNNNNNSSRNNNNDNNNNNSKNPLHGCRCTAHWHNGPVECSMLRGLQPAPLPCSPQWRRRPAAACTAPAPPARAMQQDAGWTPGCSGDSEGGDSARLKG
jgi:hypothetical protein